MLMLELIEHTVLKMKLMLNRNFRAVVPNVVENDDVDTLVLQTGSIEITNIDVNKAVMDTKKQIEEYKSDWFRKVEKDSSNLFSVAEAALKQSKGLKKVIIIKRLPRFDRSRDDILGIKSQLSNYANMCYDQIWLRKGQPENIVIASLNGFESSGYLRNIIYVKPSSPSYDGIHFRGLHGARHISYRAVQMIKSVIPLKSVRKCENTANKRNISSRAQYKARHVRTNQRKANHDPSQSGTGSNDNQSSGGYQDVRYSDVVSGINHAYNVPTQNKYDPLNC